MSEGGWIPSEREAPRLPRLDDLPTAPEGYDPQAVREAFDAFYRHAAELDSTLRMLESVDAFQRHAADLRADIRALRAASWGPVPAPRADAWPAGGRRRSRAGAGGAISDAFPRVVAETAFILLVAVGAAVAGVSTPLVVALVGAAWLIVGAAEVIASAAGPRLGRRRAVAVAPPVAAEPPPTVAAAPIEVETGEHPPPAGAESDAAAEPAAVADEELPVEEPFVEEPVVEEPVVEPSPVAEEAAAPAEEPAAATAAEEESAPAEEVVADVEAEDEDEEAVVAGWPEPAPIDEEEAPAEPAAVAAAADPWEAPPELPAVDEDANADERGPRLRFWRRRREPEEEALYPEPSGHVHVISVRPAGQPEADEADHALEGVQPAEDWNPPAEYERPAGEKLRRGRR
jgi:hypothetical protein